MPELPEVEVICRGLRPHLLDRTITAVTGDGLDLRQPVPLAAMQAVLPGKTLLGVERRAKYLQFFFTSGDMLLIHLGMTGNLGIFSPQRAKVKHDHLQWQLDNATELRYWDSRRFGAVSLLSPTATANREQTVFQHLGPEPFSESFSPSYLEWRARGKKGPVKVFLMTNQIVTGIGNIYANESLYAAGIHPARPTGSLTERQWHRLHQEIRRVLAEAIACGGSTISDFVDANRQRGYFQINFQVYGRDGEPCFHCGVTVAAIRLGGRASFFCPCCQG